MTGQAEKKSSHVESRPSLQHDEQDSVSPVAKTNLIQTSMNITKLCMGTGTLALPFSVGQGGLLFNVIGIALVAQWNIYGVDRLVRCLEYIQDYRKSFENLSLGTDIESVEMTQSTKDSKNKNSKGEEHSLTDDTSETNGYLVTYDSIEKVEDGNPIENESIALLSYERSVVEMEAEPSTNTFGKVAWYAFGEMGLHFNDILVIVLFIGVIVAYEDATLSFLAKTPLTTGSKGYDSIIMLAFIAPIACISNFELISKFSAFGIFIIFGIFISIGAYGISYNGVEGFNLVTKDHLWPTDFSSFSNWFGVAAFGYGIVPFNYNIQESMEDQTQMNTATKIACWTVCATYIAIGDIISIIFLPTIPEFEGDVISALPQTTFPILIRIAMTFVVLSTLPLIIVPAGDLIMKKMDMNESQLNVVGIRLAVCFLGAYTSVVVPNFVYVISFLGCFCISMLSFVYPPLVHLVCHYKYGEGRNVKDDNGGCQLNVYIIDSLLLIIGMTATIFTSIMTYESLIKQMQ